MARYINDDAPITPNIRKADKVSPQDFEKTLIQCYNQCPSVIQTKHTFSKHNYGPNQNYVEDLVAVLSLENPNVERDISNIDFGMENFSTQSQNIFRYAGDQGTDLCGIQQLPNGLTFCGIVAGGDWECPLFYIIYQEDNNLRAYIPIRGNVVNADTLSAFGSECNLNNPNAPYTLPDLYYEYQAKNLLDPPTTTLDDFINGTRNCPTTCYMSQYGLQIMPYSPQYMNAPNMAGFNWDAIKEELETSIEIK